MKKNLLKSVLAVALVSATYLTYQSVNNDIPEEYQMLIDNAEKYKGYTSEQLKEIPKRDRPDLAALQYFEMTMDPKLGYPPAERKIEAFEIAQSILRKTKSRAKIDGVTWEERGPNNVAGRTHAIMFDPNDPEAKKVWAGAMGGGLWYNNDITNEKSIWHNVDDLMANIAIGSIAYDPSNTQNYYLGTGSGMVARIRGAGIWKSTDAGATWDRLSSTENSEFYYTQKIQITDEGIVLAATNSGLKRSNDGGATWSNVLDDGISDMEISSDGTIYASKGHNSAAAIFKSEDDGETWIDISPADAAERVEIGLAPSNAEVIYAVADGGSGNNDVAWFKKSTDGGDSWVDIEIPLYLDQSCDISTQHFTRGQAFFDLIIGVHPLNENVVVVGGIDLHKSTDGGASWKGVSYWTGRNCLDLVHADQHAMIFRPGHPNEAIFGNDGGVYYSTDVGNASIPQFEPRNNGYNVTTFYSASAVNEVNSNVFLAGAQDNGTQLFRNEGINSTTEATGGDGGFCFIDQNNSDIMISSFTNNNYSRSINGGKSFSTISSDDDGRFINPSEYDSDAGILYGAGETNSITRIKDIPGTPNEIEKIFISINDRQITHIKSSPHTDNVLFIGVRVSTGEGKLYKLEDANTNPVVTEITGTYTGSHGGWISSIDVGESDNHILATFSNYGVSSVYETMDGGINWVDKNGDLPDMPVNWGLYNPNNRSEVLLATEVGIWSTDDLSLETPIWEPSNEGLANVRTDMIKYRSSDQMVIIATFGRGLYTSDVFVAATDANFSTKQTVAYVGVPVQFTDASLNPKDSWTWTFGDGTGTSIEQNPSYIYSAPGSYSVTLAIDGGSSDSTKTNYIKVLPVKPMPYTLADGGDFESNLEDFAAQSILSEESNWQLGIPTNRLTTVSSGTNAWKTSLDSDIGDLGYNHKSGLYTPAFDLTDDSKEYTVKFKKSMENGGCNAPIGMQMQYSIDGGIIWHRLGNSTAEYGAINWYNRGTNLSCSVDSDMFEDKTGWVASSDNAIDNQNTEYKLNFLAGESNVSFRFVSAVIDGYGSGYENDGFMIDDFEITVSNPLAEFEADVLVGFVGQEINFSYVSNGATSYLWDFGDGVGTSEEKNPAYTYSSDGSYSVSLTIQSASGEDQVIKNDYITIIPYRSVPYELENGGNFESNQLDFLVDNVSGTPFELGSSSIPGKDGTASGTNAWITGLTEEQYANDSEAYLYTPSFDFTSLGDYVLNFKAKFVFEANWDGFIVEYSIDNGGLWEKLNNVKESNWYNQLSVENSVWGLDVPIFSGNTNGVFEEYFTDVSFLAPNQSVSFRFKFLSDGNEVEAGLALDDFELIGPPSGEAIPDFTYIGGSGCVGQKVIFTNTSSGSISNLTWDFGVGAEPATAEGIGPHEVEYSTVGESTVTLEATSAASGSKFKTETIPIAALHTPTITQVGPGNSSGFELLASEGESYQWYKTGEKIEGATDILYNAPDKSFYSVDVTVSGCTVRTDNLTVISGLSDFTAQLNHDSFYPNPTVGDLNILLKNEFKGEVSITLYNIQGKIQVLNKDFVKSKAEEEFLLNVGQLNSGIYIAEVVYGSSRLIRQVVIGN